MRNRRSYILVELLLATVLVGIALVGIMGAFATSVRAHTAHERRTAGLLLAAREFEDIKDQVMSLEALTVERDSTDPDGFRIETEFAPVPDSPIVRVRVSVSRGEDSVALVRYFSRPVMGSGS